MGDGCGRHGSCKRSGTSDLRPPPSGKHPDAHLPSRPARHSPLSGHCGPGHLAAGSISGLPDGPCGQGGGEGRRGPRVVRYKEVWVREEGEEGRPDRGRGMAARPGSGREERRGRGGGRESGGRKQCSRRSPGRVPLPNAATEARCGDVAPAARGGPGRWFGAPQKVPAFHAPEAPAATGWLGREGPLAGGVAPTAARPGDRPARTPPQQDLRAGCRVGRDREGGGGRGGGDGGSGQARLALGSAGRKLAGLARGSAARILHPRHRACAREPARRAAGRGPTEQRPLPGAGDTAGGVSARTPCPRLPARVEAPEGPSGRSGQPALEQPPSLPQCRSDGGQASAPLLGSVCAQGPSPAGAFIRSQAFPGAANVTGPVLESTRRAAWWLSRSSQGRQANRQALGNN